MPATHVQCCGELWTVESVLNEHLLPRRNNCEWTYELAAAMLDHSVAHPSNEDPSRISTTTLTAKCMRNQALNRTTDYVVELADLYAAFRGTLLHGQLERFVSPNSYGEVRFAIKDLGTKIPYLKQALPRKDRSFSGSPDLVDPNVGILYDYKRTKEVPRFNSVWPDHVQQLNINRWLVDNADTVEVSVDRIHPSLRDKLPSWAPDVDKLVLDLADPRVRPLFVPVEWQELVIVYVDDKGPKPITATESIDVPTLKGGTKKARVPALWSNDRVEEFIVEKYIEARTSLTLGLAPIPKGWENQSHVLCGYCPVRALCAQLESEGH